MRSKQRTFISWTKKMLLRMHPIHRLLSGVVCGAVFYVVTLHKGLTPIIHSMAAWDVFSFVMLSLSWVVIATRTPQEIRQLAIVEDGSLAYVYSTLLLSSFVGVLNVLLLMVNEVKGIPKLLYVPVALLGLIFSWMMVHTTFIYHYARLYYSNDALDKDKHQKGLSFKQELYPDYLDFAYYSFVIGMTFQVSDVETTSRSFRRVTLLHSLISFALNTFVISLTVNLVAGLKG